MNKRTMYEKNIFLKAPLKKTAKKHVFSQALIGLSILSLTACVSVPSAPKKPPINALKQQCDQRLNMVGDISSYLQKGMKNNALTKKMMKDYALPASQQGEVLTLTYYINESLINARNDSTTAATIEPKSHQKAYKQWCYDSLVNGNKTAWLPDYFKIMLAE
jgi:hypothetical protein